MPTCLLFPFLVETLMNRKLDHEQIIAFQKRKKSNLYHGTKKINMQIHLRYIPILNLL